MSKENAHAYELLRRRDALLRSRQVWAAGLVIWAVVLGWVVWGLINALTDDADLRLVWLVVWLLPVLVLAGGAARHPVAPPGLPGPAAGGRPRALTAGRRRDGRSQAAVPPSGRSS